MKHLPLIALAFTLSLAGCGNPDPPPLPSAHEAEYKGNHLLHQLRTSVGVDGKLTSEYLLITNLVNASASTYTKVTFSWLNNSGQYQYTELPVNMIRVQTAPGLQQPYVKFRWTPSVVSDHEGIIYAVFVLDPKDYPSHLETQQVGLPPSNK